MAAERGEGAVQLGGHRVKEDRAGLALLSRGGGRQQDRKSDESRAEHAPDGGPPCGGRIEIGHRLEELSDSMPAVIVAEMAAQKEIDNSVRRLCETKYY